MSRRYIYSFNYTDLDMDSYRAAMERAAAFIAALRQKADPKAEVVQEHGVDVHTCELVQAGDWYTSRYPELAPYQQETNTQEDGWTRQCTWWPVEVHRFLHELDEFMRESSDTYRVTRKRYQSAWDLERGEKKARHQEIGLQGLLDDFDDHIDDCVSEAEAARWG